MHPFSALRGKQNFESISCKKEVTEILYQDRHSFCLGSRKAHLDGEHRMCCYIAVLISGHYVQKDPSVVCEWEHKKNYDVCLNAVDEVA
jgi:hypothetical protein